MTVWRRARPVGLRTSAIGNIRLDTNPFYPRADHARINVKPRGMTLKCA
jgi:hypothetical protein